MSKSRSLAYEFTKPMRQAFAIFNTKDPKDPKNKAFNDLVKELKDKGLYESYLNYIANTTPENDAIFNYLSPPEQPKTMSDVVSSALTKSAGDTKDSPVRGFLRNNYLHYFHFSLFKTNLNDIIKRYAEMEEMVKQGVPANSAPGIYNKEAIQINAALLNNFMEKLDEGMLAIAASVLSVIGIKSLKDLIIEYISVTDDFLNFIDNKPLTFQASSTAPRM